MGELPAAGERGPEGALLWAIRWEWKLKSPQRTREGELLITPKPSETEWYRWLENLQDWCISRQLWWGHRCPAYFVNIEGADQDVSHKL